MFIKNSEHAIVSVIDQCGALAILHNFGNDDTEKSNGKPFHSQVQTTVLEMVSYACEEKR